MHTKFPYFIYVRFVLFLMLEEYIPNLKVSSQDGREELRFEMVAIRDLAYSILY